MAPLQLTAVPETLSDISIQLMPPSTEPYKLSPLSSAPLSVPVIFCDAILVKKSVALVPVSALKVISLTTTADDVVSSVTKVERTVSLPAESINLMVIRLSPSTNEGIVSA